MNPVKHFLMAVQFYSRIPIPFTLDWKEDSLNKATAYFPLVGVFLAAHLCVIYYFAQMIFNPSVAALITFGISLLMTGGFHEDGFADYCDGVGGGWTRTQKLQIMKDSRLGTYGALGLLTLFLLRWQAFIAIPYPYQYWALFIAMTWSRWSAMLVMITLPYVRDEGIAKPLAKGLTMSQFFIGGLFAWIMIVPLGYTNDLSLIFTLPILLVAALFMRSHMKRKLGGYTGDSLGATQQVAEVAYYLGLVALWKFF